MAGSKTRSSTDAKRLGDPQAEDFLLQNSPFYLLAQVNGRYTLDMERSLKSVGMDLPRWRVLMVVHVVTSTVFVLGYSAHLIVGWPLVRAQRLNGLRETYEPGPHVP